ncbi:unnamed protein product [Darwinula stevensoni]|uniref:Uncharacterized protein n=1 Tax=Darwinula stevensoni TaxID=69355 RepID=A0A7R9A2G3_9CRUS|nr:unnamed protein product [Darwinula stevensoni]CAG0879857.1 unnamed protein product [Darwinula stevensoni]
MENNGPKREFLKLLNDSSDSGSEVPHYVVPFPRIQTAVPPGRRKIFRKRRRRSSASFSGDIPRSEKYARTCHCSAQLWAWLILFTCSLSAFLTLLWLLNSMHTELSNITLRLQEVELQSNSIPEELHSYQSRFGLIEKNVTEFRSQLSSFSTTMQQLTSQIQEMQGGVKKLESNLDAGPQLLSLPKDMAVLQQSVADFGSQLADIDSRVKSLREDYDSLENSDNDLIHRITSLEGQVKNMTNRRLSSYSSQAESRFSALENGMNSLNETLNWVVEDLHKQLGQIEELRPVTISINSMLSCLEVELRTCCPNVSTCSSPSALKDFSTSMEIPHRPCRWPHLTGRLMAHFELVPIDRCRSRS